ncbi:phosphoribosylaminoimidazolesuccinocarboxamide synthase [Bacillus sp. 2205SS5-2]|uniref:phosphoribosylaminoimidazolesuccinocarboxamide synthase n=1 Tax=Bacillus sp. 2205SS5-2 TaxID=3109031 RepID=UPI0030050130
MGKRELLYEGKAKKIYATAEKNTVWIQYKDSATAFNGEKKAEIEGKAALNNKITSLIFAKLASEGISSHFLQTLSETEQLVKKVDIIPLEVVIRNIVAGSLSKRIGVAEGTRLKRPIVEFYYKDDELGDPLLTDEHIEVLELATVEERRGLREKALQINSVLQPFFLTIGIELVDFKLEFGKDENHQILLADEISPDTCRLWDLHTKEKLDKDVFRRNIGDITDAYSTILTRLGGE